MTNISFELDKNEELIKATNFGNNLQNKSVVNNLDLEVNSAYSDTGLLPVSGTGLLQLRRYRNFYQFVYQVEPSTTKIFVNGSKAQLVPFLNFDTSKWFEVSQPYLIIVGLIQVDKKSSHLIGARHFYSPESIINLNQQLYHTNLPNTNAMFYGHSGLGWVCLYQENDPPEFNLSLKKAIARVRGGEGYNANMSWIDGAALYWRYNAHPGFISPNAWQQYTKEDPDFVLKEEHLLPISVFNINTDRLIANTDLINNYDLSSMKLNEELLVQSIYSYMKENYKGQSSFSRQDYINGMIGIPYTLGAAVYGIGHNSYSQADPVSRYFQTAHPEYFKDVDLTYLPNGLDIFAEDDPRGKDASLLNVGSLMNDLSHVPTRKSFSSSSFSIHITPPQSVVKPKLLVKPYADQKCIFTGEVIGNNIAVPVEDGYALASEVKNYAVLCSFNNKWIRTEHAIYSPVDKSWYDKTNLPKGILTCVVCKNFTMNRLNKHKVCNICFHTAKQKLVAHKIFDKDKPLNQQVFMSLGIENQSTKSTDTYFSFKTKNIVFHTAQAEPEDDDNF